MGATWNQQGINFALFSRNATRVELCLFDTEGGAEIARFDLPGHTGDIWHGFMPGSRAGTHYAYYVHGPGDPENGHRFDATVPLSDPYARALSVELPATVILEIIEADPVTKGQTASSSYKPAVLSNGVRTAVPPHVAAGTRIVVMTEDGSYVERAKD